MTILNYQSPFTGQEIDVYLAKAATALQADTGVLLSSVDDTPVDGATAAPISSNWAYDHAAGLGGHVFTQTGAGAVARTLEAKLKDTVHVEDFGAVGDGVTNDTTAIQAAIDYCTALGGGTVMGNTHKVCLALGIVVKSNVIVKNLRLKTAVAGTDSIACVKFDAGCEHARLENVTVDGNKASQTQTNVAGIDVYGTRNVVQNCRVFNTKRTGVRIFPGCTHCDVVGSTVHDTDGHGITHEVSLSTPSYYCTIAHNNVYNIGISGITFLAGDGTNPSAGVKHWKVTNNTVYNTGLVRVAGGIGGYSPNNEHVLVANNVLEKINNHMFHLGGDFISIVGNVGKDITNGAIIVRNFPNDGGGVGAPMGKGCTITGNVIHLSYDNLNQDAGDGINVTHYTDFTVSGNQIYGSASCGIRIEGEALGSTTRRSTDGTIAGNVIGESDKVSTHSGTTEVGILIENSDRVAVTGNTVNKCYESNIVVRGATYVSVVGNISTGSKTGNGIYFREDSGGTTVSSYLVADGNVCTSNANFGILASGTINNVNIVNNLARGNTVGNINIAGLGTSCVVSLNNGYRTRNGGRVTRANGQTFDTYVEGTITRYQVTPTVANRFAAITNVTGSVLTLSLTDSAGNPVTTPEPVVWEASSEIT